ncbi:hypothetical protein ACRRTK_016060 [Alexandromys fortis]
MEQHRVRVRKRSADPEAGKLERRPSVWTISSPSGKFGGGFTFQGRRGGGAPQKASVEGLPFRFFPNVFQVEDVVGSHVEDAVTFWAQNISKNKDIMKLNCSLSEVCPHANSVFGNLDPKKGRTFLGSLIFEKEIKMRIKATYQDGTVIAQAEYGTVDIGEEVAKKGFAEKCRLTSGIDVCEAKKPDPSQLALRSLKNPIPLWGRRSNQSSFNRPKGQFNGKLTLDVKHETNAGNHVTFPKENLAAGDFNLGSNVSLAKIKQDQKLIEEIEKLKTEKEVLLENYKALEMKVEQTAQELQQEKTTTMDLTKHLESTLKTCVGTRLKNLAAKVELLKEIRHINISIRFGNDLSDAMQVLNEGSFTTLESLNELEKIWAEYNVAQEKIKTCLDENEGSILIAKRNEVQQNLFMAVDVFILEVDELPLDKRLKTLQDLTTSLEAVYGKAKEGTNSEEILRKFYDWQCNKREEFASIRSETEASLQHLVAWFQSSQKEQGVVDKEIILSTYSQVLQKIHSEEKFIATLLAKYKDSVESDDHDGTEIEKIKQEITQLRNSVFQKIYHEREEYNSGGLLTMSLERDLLDTEPMKELSSKRPLVCSDVNGQPVLLKSYSVDVDTEGRVIQRAASYHRACGDSKEESGLLPLIFLFLCKEALKVMKGVARGLYTLHNANIIHGSLHQNNVFALNREQGIVGDFDFTKSESQRASVNMMVGGLSLISPELKIGKPPSASSDLYAYGCLLLWLSVHNQEFETSEDGIPKVDQFHLGKSLPNPEKEIEYLQHNKEDESKVESLDRNKEIQEMVKPTLD